MLDLIVFTQHPKSYAPRHFTKESKILNLETKIVGYSKLDLNKLPQSRNVILREPDAKNNIYDLRDKIIRNYIFQGSNILNKDSYLEWSILDKIKQHQEFEKANIPHIKLVNLSEAKYPFIVKNKLGSHGSEVFKINTKKDLDRVLKNNHIDDLLIQEFQTSGFDLRVVVLGGNVLGIMKRTPKSGEFLSNYSQGGSVEKYEGKDRDVIKSIAIKTAKHFKLDYVGVDLMKGNDGKWKVLEVNRACQFKGFEKATGINVASEIINFLTK